jgi:hypothetical protein
MANRNFNRKQALEKEVKDLYAEVAIGSSGAPTLTKGLGVASVERTGTGEYTVTLEDAYNRLMHVNVSHEAASAEDITAQVSASDVQSAKTISFITKAADTETDPSDGSVLRIKIEVKNSSVGE